ncbi:unnamed protein product [Echinostoma caproni]|uniref:(Fe-S)-binding protein n=1 Tax=Echinostoma caproni TaxID=27848 RepID=A0A183B6Y4_9TREM|nr:unnamed protein product [Echinostoma caproni]
MDHSVEAGLLVTFCAPCYLCHMYQLAGENCAIPLMGVGPALLRSRQRFRHKIKVRVCARNSGR